MKFLLIQLRKDPETLISERTNFITHSGLSDQDLVSLDAYRNIHFDPEILYNYQGFFIGGLSDDPSNDVNIHTDLYPFLDSLNGLLYHAEKSKIPGLLSCGGFMLASRYWGGEISIEKDRQEMGVYDLHFNKMSANDILLKNFPASIKIVSGHLKSTMDTPPKCILLASTERCPIHVLRLQNAPVYAFQGHPEITTNDLKDRVTPYKYKYFDNEVEFRKFIQLTADTKPINSLLSRFVKLIREEEFNRNER